MRKKEETNKNLPPNKEEKRWELFYNYSKEIYNREEDRYERIEEKALHCLTAFSLILAIYGFLWKHVLNEVFPPDNFIKGFLSVLSVLLLLCFIFSWVILFKTFQTEKRKIMPLNKEMLNFFEDKSIKLSKLYKSLGDMNREAYKDNRIVTDEEKESFKLGYRWVKYSVIGFIIFIIMYTTYLWCQAP